jgi:hypothetical protein
MRKLAFLAVLLLELSCNAKQEGSTNMIDTTRNVRDSVATSTPPDEQLELAGTAQISKSDSSFWVSANIKNDYRIFGYAAPDVNSEKLILFSVFTKDVQDNPYKCRLGAYYGSNRIESGEIKYMKDTGKFVKTIFQDDKKNFEIFFPRAQVKFISN